MGATLRRQSHARRCARNDKPRIVVKRINECVETSTNEWVIDSAHWEQMLTVEFVTETECM